MAEEQRNKRGDEWFILTKLEDEISDLSRVVKNLSDETTKLVAATIDITSKLTEFIIKQDNIYRMLLELVSMLKEAASKGEDPLINSVKEVREEWRG